MNHLPRLAACGLAVSLLIAAPALAALKPGDKAPEFSAPAYLAGEPFTYELAAALEKGPVVLYFFPAAHTPGCNLEAALFSQAIDKFKARHATVIGVTAGNTDELADFSKETEHCGGKFPVAADPGAKIAAEYDAVKLRCRVRHPEDSHAYSDCKHAWIQRAQAQALRWRAGE